jgi:hypothetical protein
MGQAARSTLLAQPTTADCAIAQAVDGGIEALSHKPPSPSALVRSDAGQIAMVGQYRSLAIIDPVALVCEQRLISCSDLP